MNKILGGRAAKFEHCIQDVLSIESTERVELQATSVVHGDVATKRLLVQEGGEVNGVIRMGEGAPTESAAATF